MAAGRTIVRNSLFLGLAFVVSKGSSIALTAIAGRVLGATGFGLYATGAALVEVGRIVASAGLDYLVAREVASDVTTADRVTRHAILLKVTFGAVVYAVLAGGVFWAGYPPEVFGVVLVVGVALFLENFSDTIDAVFQGVDRMHLTTIGFAVSSLFVLVTGAAALSAGLGVLGYAACFAGGYAVRAVVMMRAATRAGHLRPTLAGLERLEFGRLLRASVPLLGATVLAMVFHRMDLLVLGVLVVPAQVGLYAAAVRIVDVVVLVPRILATAVYPSLRREIDRDPVAATRLVAHATRLSLVACSAAALGVWVLAPFALRWIPGPEFVGATDALRLLAWGIVLQGGAHMLARLLLALEAERDFALVAGVSLMVNLVLDLWWIPRFGIEGAAGATLCAYAVNLSLYFVATARRGRPVPVVTSLLGPTMAVAAAALVSRFAPVDGEIARAALMVAAWALVLVLAGGLRRSDLARLRELRRGDD